MVERNNMKSKKLIDRDYYLSHKKECLERTSVYYQLNKQKIAKRKREWYKRKDEKMPANIISINGMEYFVADSKMPKLMKWLERNSWCDIKYIKPGIRITGKTLISSIRRKWLSIDMAELPFNNNTEAR